MNRRQTVAVALAFGAMALLVIAARLMVDSAAALRAGEEALARGETDEAIRRYREAVRLYVPGSPFVRRGLDGLAAIAGRAEKGGDLDTARLALEAARGALLGTRSFYTPFADRLPDLDRGLASIYARLEMGARTGSSSEPERSAWHAARLAQRPGPSLFFAIVALTGLLCWVAAAVAFIGRGLDENVRMRRRPALLCGAVFVAGFALFIIGLRLA